MGNEEKLFDDDENWLHEEWIVCPACNQSLFRLDASPLDNSNHFYADRCPVRIDVIPYGPEYEQLEQSLALSQDDKEHSYADYRGVLMRAIEAHLKPCTCGGMVRHDAPRRCFSCSLPVISDDPDGVDLYPDEDAFERELDPQRQERLERWQAQFLPHLENPWKGPSETES